MIVKVMEKVKKKNERKYKDVVVKKKKGKKKKDDGEICYYKRKGHKIDCENTEDIFFFLEAILIFLCYVWFAHYATSHCIFGIRLRFYIRISFVYSTLSFHWLPFSRRRVDRAHFGSIEANINIQILGESAAVLEYTRLNRLHWLTWR